MDSQNQSEHDDEIEVSKYRENEEDKEETKRSNAAVSKLGWLPVPNQQQNYHYYAEFCRIHIGHQILK